MLDLPVEKRSRKKPHLTVPDPQIRKLQRKKSHRLASGHRQRVPPSWLRRSSRSDAHRQAEASVEEHGQWRAPPLRHCREKVFPSGAKGDGGDADLHSGRHGLLCELADVGCGCSGLRRLQRKEKGKGGERLAGHELVAGRRREAFRRRPLCGLLQPPPQERGTEKGARQSGG
jgi:hypothetical protein